MILKLIIWYFVINSLIWFAIMGYYKQQNKEFPNKIKTLTFLFGLPLIIYEVYEWLKGKSL